ncbi:MAG: M48 family metallopeptidase [Planctomycetes bacterium]|nr:M48 family metallopeptidase [Planctomycetota bacterium]
MAIETFHSLFARNRRNSLLLMFIFLILFVGVALLIGMVWGGGDAIFSVMLALAAAVLAFVLMMLSYFQGSSAILAVSKARRLNRSDDPQLQNVVEEIAIAGGIPPPKIYVIDDSAPNAFATGRNPKHAVVAITTGLRNKLTRDELQGVMAHEISHIRNNDILFAMLMSVMVGMLVMLCDIFLRSLWFGGGRGARRRRGSGDGQGAAQIIMMLVALILAIIAPILARVIQMAMSRQREYLADASAIELTRNPYGLIDALKKLTADKEVLEVANRATAHLYIVHPIKKFEERSSNIFDTHPPLTDRINRLKNLTI